MSEMIEGSLDWAEGDAFEKPYRRARRALRHLWAITRGDMSYNPDGCDGCKEIFQFLTDPDYYGDQGYPVGVEDNPLGEAFDQTAALGPHWKLNAEDMALPAGPGKQISK